jgi:hypothetical protein
MLVRLAETARIRLVAASPQQIPWTMESRMPKVMLRAPVARLPLVMAAMSVLALAACDDSVDPFPSRGPATGLEIHRIPASAPNVVLRGQTLRLLGVPVDTMTRAWVDVPVTWTSSNPAIATVTPNAQGHGVVTAVGNVNPTNVDTITITATAGGLTRTQRVIIRQFPAVATVGITPVSPFYAPGQTIQLTASPRDAAGTLIPGHTPVWGTTSALVATVSSTGLVTIVGEGTANITARVMEDEGPVTGSTAVSVAPTLAPGALTAVPTIADGGWRDYTIMVPAGATSLVVQLSGATSGDADLYVFAPATTPGAAPGFAGFTCRPFLVGSNETCTIAAPAPGSWGIRIHAYPGDGNVANISVRATVN